MEAGEADAEVPRRRMVSWNEYDGPVSSLRFGYGFLVDYATYLQDDESKQQVNPQTDWGPRDFRVLFKGRFKTERPFSWTLGYMYDGPTKDFRFRQTGIMIAVPEILGHLFIGRTKEGYSMIKVMVGYHGWTNERSTSNDAFVPILADGIKWMGYAPKQRLLWNLGYFVDVLSKSEAFSTYENQLVGRFAWLPILSEPDGELLHVALMGRYTTPDDGDIKLRSRPESFLAPYYIETATFKSDHSNTYGFEAFYRKRAWLVGVEYNVQDVDSAEGGNPLFYGGDVAITWVMTGETRPYNTVGGYFTAISPERTIFEGGPGAWEAVLRASYTDLDDGTLTGGKFWRVTPMVNWHMSDNFRLEFTYGYGVLDRFDLEGTTQFFQFRFQTSL